jgi:formylglycine-generating enzyme required for sulfatase activity
VGLGAAVVVFGIGLFAYFQASLQPASFRDSLKSGGQGPEMVRLPKGQFQMGSPPGEQHRASNEGPQHPVVLQNAIAFGRFEVTRGEIERFAKETGYTTDAEKGKGCSRRTNQPSTNWRSVGFYQDASHPVVCVSWNDARAYADWLSAETGEPYRFPTEAEWEYAARAAESTSRFWWGDEVNEKDTTWANCDGCGDTEWDGKKTAPVGQFPANEFGLHDTSGNVWEWVQDCWHDSYEGAPGDASPWLETDGGDCTRRVVRGGSWGGVPWYVRSASRTRYTADYRNYGVGFRLAQDID